MVKDDNEKSARRSKRKKRKDADPGQVFAFGEVGGVAMSCDMNMQFIKESLSRQILWGVNQGLNKL